MRTILLVLSVCVVVLGCEEFDDRPASRDVVYDTACAVDADCAVVSYASCALCGSCGDTAINVDEVGRFDADNTVTCPPHEPVACGACLETIAVCTDGACEMHVCEDDGTCAP